MKFFEAINEQDQSIVIDDTFKNLELIDHFPLSQCTFEQDSGGNNHGSYLFPSSNANVLLAGISINQLSGVEPFGLFGLGGSISFYDKKSGAPQKGIFPVKRDDIASKAEVYRFGFTNINSSTHGTGLEICNADGKIIFSSDKKYLHVIGCGSDNAQTIMFGDGVHIAFTLGTDHVTKIYESHKFGAHGAEYDIYPRFSITSNSVTVGKLKATSFYAADEEPEPYPWNLIYNSWFNYGWLIGEIS